MDREAFIHVRNNGSVKVSGGLVFCRGYAVHFDGGEYKGVAHSLDNNVFITHLPRWWQISRWVQLLRYLREYTTKG